jgi:type II secretory pathway component PulF
MNLAPPTSPEHELNDPDPRPDANPYARPSAELAMESTPAGPRRFDLLFWLMAAGAAFFSLILGLLGSFVVPAFDKIYASFGADMPWATAFVVSTRVLWWVVPALVAGLCAYSLWAHSRLQYRSQLLLAFVFLALGSMAMMAFVVVALYSPIFTLGNPM